MIDEDAKPSPEFEKWASEEGINNFHFYHCWAAWQAALAQRSTQIPENVKADERWNPPTDVEIVELVDQFNVLRRAYGLSEWTAARSEKESELLELGLTDPHESDAPFSLAELDRHIEGFEAFIAQLNAADSIFANAPESERAMLLSQYSVILEGTRTMRERAVAPQPGASE